MLTLAAASLCLHKSWWSLNIFAIPTSRVSVRLLSARASIFLYKKMSFLGTVAGWFRLLLIPQWCCSDPPVLSFRQKRFLPIRLKVFPQRIPDQLSCVPRFLFKYNMFCLIKWIALLKTTSGNRSSRPMELWSCAVLYILVVFISLSKTDWIPMNCPALASVEGSRSFCFSSVPVVKFTTWSSLR